MASAVDNLHAMLELARRQAVALADDDLDEFNRLTAERAKLMQSTLTADSTDRRSTVLLAAEILAQDERHAAIIQERSASATRELAEIHRNERALRGYDGLGTAARPGARFVDRSA